MTKIVKALLPLVSLFAARAFAIDVCDGKAAPPTAVTTISLAPHPSSKFWVLSELVTAPLTIVAVGVNQDSEISCLNLIQGTEVDVIEAMPQIRQIAFPKNSGKGFVRIVRPPRRDRLELPAAGGTNPCAMGNDSETIMHMGSSFQGVGRTLDALKCFERAVELDERSVGAHLGVAQIGNLARRNEEFVRSHLLRVRELEPILAYDVDLRIASLGLYRGRASAAVSALKTLLNQELPVHYQDRAGSLVSGWSESDGSLKDAIFGQEFVVRSLARLKQAGSERATDFWISFECNRLGLMLEAQGNYDGALATYRAAIGVLKSDLYLRRLDLGRLRVLRRLGSMDGVERECTGWRRKVERISYHIPYRRAGGLDIVRAEIAFACGERDRGLKILNKLTVSRPEWGDPGLTLSDYLLSVGRWEQAQEVRRIAFDLKRKQDAAALRSILKDLEGLVPD